MPLEQIWPEELDALTASPENHVLLLENDKVRVLETVIQPGETTAIHTHRFPAATYVLSWSDCVRRSDQGEVTYDSRVNGGPSFGQAIWMPSLEPHSLENVGNQKIHVISVELKD